MAKCQCCSFFLQTKSGIALLYNEETNNTYDVCLKLTKEVLTIQKLDVVCTNGTEAQVNVSAPEGSSLAFCLMPHLPEYFFSVHNIFLPIRNSNLLKHRTVVLRRQTNGGLGLSIKVSRSRWLWREWSIFLSVFWYQISPVAVKPHYSPHFQGGAEHNVPVVISKIFKDQVGKEVMSFLLLLWCRISNPMTKASYIRASSSGQTWPSEALTLAELSFVAQIYTLLLLYTQSNTEVLCPDLFTFYVTQEYTGWDSTWKD